MNAIFYHIVLRSLLKRDTILLEEPHIVSISTYITLPPHCMEELYTGCIIFS